MTAPDLTWAQMIYDLATRYPLPLYGLAVLVVLVFGVERGIKAFKGKGGE